MIETDEPVDKDYGWGTRKVTHYVCEDLPEPEEPSGKTEGFLRVIVNNPGGHRKGNNTDQKIRYFFTELPFEVGCFQEVTYDEPFLNKKVYSVAMSKGTGLAFAIKRTTGRVVWLKATKVAHKGTTSTVISTAMFLLKETTAGRTQLTVTNVHLHHLLAKGAPGYKQFKKPSWRQIIDHISEFKSHLLVGDFNQSADKVNSEIKTYANNTLEVTLFRGPPQPPDDCVRAFAVIHKDESTLTPSRQQPLNVTRAHYIGLTPDKFWKLLPPKDEASHLAVGLAVGDRPSRSAEAVGRRLKKRHAKTALKRQQVARQQQEEYATSTRAGPQQDA